jgi:cyclopropane-fatty-acyl-phospholipid synthase
MSIPTTPGFSPAITVAPKASSPAPASAQIILKLLSKLRHGTLHLRTPDGQLHSFGSGGIPLRLEMHSWDLFGAALRSGDIGFAESYIDDQWRTDDLPGLIALLIRNREQMEAAV